MNIDWHGLYPLTMLYPKPMIGIRIIESPYAYKTHRHQVRFPRSKKRRIREKWAKQEKNFRVDHIPQAYQIGEDMIVHPAVARQIRRQLAAQIDRDLESAMFGGSLGLIGGIGA